MEICIELARNRDFVALPRTTKTPISNILPALNDLLSVEPARETREEGGEARMSAAGNMARVRRLYEGAY